MTVTIERLSTGEGDRWRMIRMRALREAPYAFGTTAADAATWPAPRWEQQVTDFATFVAVLGGDDVGVARGATHERADVRALISIWVDPVARRHGVGSHLIDAVAEWAKQQGATTLVLNVREHNDPAIATYARSGFELHEDGTMGAPPPGELRMVKVL